MGVSPRQALAIKRSVATTNLWYGSVRSGKTHASIWAFFDRVANHKGEGVNVIIGINRNTVWQNIFRLLNSHRDFAAIASSVKYRQGAASGTIDGVEFQVVSAQDESSWLLIQGLTIANALGDEVTGWPKSFWDMLETRLSLPHSWFLGTCNPGTSTHYLVDNVIKRADGESYHVEKMLLRHNPFVSDVVKQRYERIFKGVFRKRMLLAEWVAAEGSVYEAWDSETMVKKHSVSNVVAVGIDYGTQHPTAGYAIGVGASGRLEVCAEWSPNLERGAHRRLTDSQLADNLESWLELLPSQPRYIYCDPAAASFREELKQRGMVTHRADNSVLDGIRQIDSLLNAGDLTIDPSCKHLQKEMSSYRWDNKATEKGRDAPIKENDDHVDALRYAVRSSRHIWRKQLDTAH